MAQRGSFRKDEGCGGSLLSHTHTHTHLFSLIASVRIVCVCACIRIVSWWMLPLSWSVFHSGQQSNRPLHRSQFLSSFTHKSLLLASSVTCSCFPTLLHSLKFLLWSLCQLLTFYSFLLFLISCSSCLFPLYPLSVLPLPLYSFMLLSHFIFLSLSLSFLSGAQSQRVDDLAGKTPSPTLRKSIMWLNAS